MNALRQSHLWRSRRPRQPSLIEPSPRDDAVLDEKKPSAATPEDANLGDDATPSDATSSVVDEVDAETDSENQVNNVLEIPQALPSGNLQASVDADPSVRTVEISRRINYVTRMMVGPCRMTAIRV